MESIRKICSCLDSTKRDVPLETLEEYNKRWRSVRIIYLTIFLKSLCLSMVNLEIGGYLTKLQDTSKDDIVYWCQTAKILAAIIWSFIFGWWSNKVDSIRRPMLTSLGVFTVASCLYSSLELFGSLAQYGMIFCFFLIGISMANVVLCHSYLSNSTRLGERAHVFAMALMMELLGQQLGRHGIDSLWGMLHDRVYFSTGLIGTVMGVIMCTLFLPSQFKEYKIAERDTRVRQETSLQDEIKPNYLSAWTLIGINFFVTSNYMALHLLSERNTRYTINRRIGEGHSIRFMDIAKLLSLITFALVGALSKYFGDRHVLIWGGISMMLLGQLLYTFKDPSIVIFLTIAVVSVGYPVLSLIWASFSKVLGSRPQGLWMALLYTFKLFAFVEGLCFNRYLWYDGNHFWIYGYTFIAMTICMTILVLFQNLMELPKIVKTSQIAEELHHLQI